MQNVRSRSRLQQVSIILAAMAISGLTFLIPVAATVANPFATHWRTAAGTMIMMTFLGAAVTFLNGLKSFKQELRIAYRLIAYGIMAFSAALIQLVIWGVFDLWGSAWAESGSGLVPYLITAGLIYAGARKFSKLLGIKGLLTSFWFVFVVTLAIGILMGIAATYWVQYDIAGTNIYIGVASWASAYILFATILVFRISKVIGASYQNAMRWLTVGLGGLFVACAHEALNTFYFNNGDTYTDYGYYLIPFVIAGLLLLRASFAFRLLPLEGVTSSKNAEATELTPQDYIESILAVESLVSQPKAIDTLLDDFRLLTSTLNTDYVLKPQDKQLLLQTYRSIETYLQTKDPLRTFTTEEVRDHVTPAFRALLEH